MIKLFLSILLLGSFAGGNLGCSTKGLVLDERKIQYFVEANQNDLKREMAKGYGDKLSTLVKIKPLVACLWICFTQANITP